MGPDYTSQQTRISGNFKRAWQFKTSQTSGNDYITVSYKDTKNYCNKIINGKAVGGYAWTYSGWLFYYHYITLWSAFFSLDTLATKIGDVEKDLASGSTRMALPRCMSMINTAYMSDVEIEVGSTTTASTLKLMLLSIPIYR